MLGRGRRPSKGGRDQLGLECMGPPAFMLPQGGGARLLGSLESQSTPRRPSLGPQEPHLAILEVLGGQTP